MKIIDRVIKEEIENIFLNENTSVDSLKTLDGIISAIFRDSQSNNLETRLYDFSENGLDIKIKVFFNRKDYYGGYDAWNETINVYLPKNPKWENIKTMVSHEMIHFMDEKRIKQYTKIGRYGKEYPKMGYDYYPKGSGYESVKSDCPISETVNNILYRLWSRTERNAYVSLAYTNDIAFCKNYINDLRSDIDEIEQSDDFDNYECWVELNEFLYDRIGLRKLKPHYNFDNDVNVRQCKKYFIKKSRYLLDDFSSKLLKNCMNNIYKNNK